MKKLISILFAAILSVSAFAQTKSRVLVAYYSDTGTTEKIAKWIAEETDAATFKVRLKNPYSQADLNWRDSGSRVNREMNDPSLVKNEAVGTLPNLDDYDIIYIGYPIWWGDASLGIRAWVGGLDFGKKTVIPFCTSGSSPIGGSAKTLQAVSKGGNWNSGRRFGAGSSRSEVRAWLKTVSNSGLK